MLDTLNRPFVTVLRAKGLSERRIIFQHVLRNSAIPMVTVFLPMFIGTATGSIFVEAMFRVPGLGAYFVSSIENRDYPLEMALMLMITVVYLHRLPDLRHRLCLAQSAHPRRGARAMSTGIETVADSPRRRPTRQRSPLYFAWRRFAANKAAVVGGIVLLILILMAIFAPLITKTGPDAQAFLTQSLAFPSAELWFGVDDLGRDFFTRIVYGARVSLDHRLFGGRSSAWSSASRSARSPAISAARSTGSSCASSSCSRWCRRCSPRMLLGALTARRLLHHHRSSRRCSAGCRCACWSGRR